MQKKLYMFYGKDKPNMLDVRQRVRESHRHHLRHHKYDIEVILAGPTLSDAEQMNGTLLLISAEKKEDVLQFIKDDPYSKQDLFESTTIKRFNPGIAKEIFC